MKSFDSDDQFREFENLIRKIDNDFRNQILTLKESVSKQLTKKADFKEIETLAQALTIKADADTLTN